MKLTPQQQRVLNHLKEFGSIEPLTALSSLGIYRLSDVIFKLRTEHNIDITWDYSLRVDILKGDFNENALNFTYDDGYGGQEMFGFIVFNDETWLERGEYDGSEWWDYKQKPSLDS